MTHLNKHSIPKSPINNYFKKCQKIPKMLVGQQLSTINQQLYLSKDFLIHTKNQRSALVFICYTLSVRIS